MYIVKLICVQYTVCRYILVDTYSLLSRFLLKQGFWINVGLGPALPNPWIEGGASSESRSAVAQVTIIYTSVFDILSVYLIVHFPPIGNGKVI